MKRKPTDAQWERFNAQSREEQIEIVKRHLEKVFDRRFKNTPDGEFQNGREHARSCFISNRLAKYIRPEDNSVRGFHRRYQKFNSPEDKERFIESRLAGFVEIPTPLPPQFVGLTNYTSDERFLEVNYQGTKATISDGSFSNTFPYYDAYSPLVDHLAVAIHIKRAKAFLGADDGEATHSLILDTEKNKIYIATRRQAHQFLEIQLPQTPEERKAADERLDEFVKNFEKPKSLGDLQALGMFQFLAPVDNRSEEVEKMIKFLDGFIPEEAQKLLNEFMRV